MKILSIGVAVLLLPLAAAAGETPTARSIVQNWRHAVHAAPCFTGHDALHLHYTAREDGLDGTLDVWIDGRGGYHRLIDRHLDHDEVVLSGDRLQRRDWNDYVRDLDGDELEQLRTEAFDTAALTCGPPEEMEASSLSDSGGLLVLRVTPPGGEEVIWSLDPKTFLPIQTERYEGEGDSVVESYSDWARSDGGTFVPHRITDDDVDGGQSVYTLGALRRDKPDFPVLKQGPSDMTMTGDVADIPFTMEANHIVFPVSANGQPPIGYNLDTGDGRESLNADRLPGLGVQTYGQTAVSGGGNKTGDAFVPAVDFALPGGAVLHRQHADSLEMTGLERAFGIPLGGIVGYDFLSRFVVEIDYQAKIIRLHRPDGWTYTGSGTILPISFDDGIPYAEAELSIPGNPHLHAHMVMDFGAAETMTFTTPFVKANNLAALIGTNDTVNKPAGLEKEFFAQNNRRGRIEELRLGGLVLRGIPVNLSTNTSGAYGTGQFAGTVGETIFSRYHVFLDYPRHRIIFETTPDTGKPFPERRTFGLGLIASGADLHGYVVTAVRAGSPAASDGFQVKDEVVQFDGKPASQFLLSQLRDWLAMEGEHHVITVNRAGKPVKIPVTISLVSIER